MIDLTKKYKTRHGQEVTNLFLLPEPLAQKTPYPIFGILNGELFNWTSNGYVLEDMNSDYDQIEEKEITKIALVFSKDHKQDYGLWRVLTPEKASSYKKYKHFKVIEIEAPEFYD